jgi:glycosyltransferase involved in cell wall biosynthesis
LPVYNGESYLREAICSVLDQTFNDFELLIIDDGSTDSSLEIINSFTDSRIRLLRNKKRCKLSGALNRGMDSASGDYIARMDADDICKPQRLATQVAFMDQHQSLGVCGSSVKMFGIRGTSVYKPQIGCKHVHAQALFDNPFVHPSVIMRRELFDRHSLRFNGDYYPTEDFELWTRALLLFPGDNIDSVLLHYRVHPHSMTNSDWSDMDAQALSIVRRELNLFGCPASEEQIKFHRSIGRQMSRQCQSRQEILSAEKWLKSLIVLNEKEKKYDPVALTEVIEDIWFRLCFNSSILGLQVMRVYWSSTLSQRDHKRTSKGVLVMAAACKNLLLSRRQNT